MSRVPLFSEVHSGESQYAHLYWILQELLQPCFSYPTFKSTLLSAITQHIWDNQGSAGV